MLLAAPFDQFELSWKSSASAAASSARRWAVLFSSSCFARAALSIYFLRSTVFGILGSPYPRIRAASAPSVVEQAPCISLRTGLFVEVIYARRRERPQVWARCERSLRNALIYERLAQHSAT